jgi:hypothetical protein
MRNAIRGLTLGVLVVSAATARAEPAPVPTARREQPPSAAKNGVDDYRLSARLGGSVGLGRPTIGGRVGVSGEYWFSEAIGMGLTASLLRQTEIFGDKSASQGVGVHGTLRGAGHGHYAYFSLGLGYARVRHEEGHGLCLGDEASCAVRATRYGGFHVTSAMGWLAHPFGDQVELGPMLRFDLLVDPQARVKADYAFTVGMELGLAR